jgi:hypothetical protein
MAAEAAAGAEIGADPAPAPEAAAAVGSAAAGTARRSGATIARKTATWPETALRAEARHAGTAERTGTSRSSVPSPRNREVSVEGAGAGEAASEAAEEAGEAEAAEAEAETRSVITGAIEESATTDRGVDSTTRIGPDRAADPGREGAEAAAPGPGTGASAGASILPTLKTLVREAEARAKTTPAPGTKAEVRTATLEKDVLNQDPEGLWTAPNEESERRLRRAGTYRHFLGFTICIMCKTHRRQQRRPPSLMTTQELRLQHQSDLGLNGVWIVCVTCWILC